MDICLHLSVVHYILKRKGQVPNDKRQKLSVHHTQTNKQNKEGKISVYFNQKMLLLSNQNFSQSLTMIALFMMMIKDYS